MGHCIDCGAEVTEDDKFCPECGASVVKKPATDLQGVRSAAAKKPEKKAEEIPKPKAKGSGMRTVISVLAVLFLVFAVAFFVNVVPRASRMHKPPLQGMSRTEDKRCDIGGEMACLDATIHENSVVLSFQNPLRRDVVITKVFVSGCEPAQLEMLIRPGEHGAIVVKGCSLGGLGSYTKAKVSAQYRLGSRTGEQREANGAIAGIVQAKLRTAAATPTSPAGEVAIEEAVARR